MPKAKFSRDTKSRQKGRTVAPSKMSAKQRASRNGRALKKGELAGESMTRKLAHKQPVLVCSMACNNAHGFCEAWRATCSHR